MTVLCHIPFLMLCLTKINIYISENAIICCAVLLQQESAVFVLQLSSSAGIAEICGSLVNVSLMNDSKANTLMVKMLVWVCFVLFFFSGLGFSFFLILWVGLF